VLVVDSAYVFCAFTFSLQNHLVGNLRRLKGSKSFVSWNVLENKLNKKVSSCQSSFCNKDINIPLFL